MILHDYVLFFLPFCRIETLTSLYFLSHSWQQKIHKLIEPQLTQDDFRQFLFAAYSLISPYQFLSMPTDWRRFIYFVGQHVANPLLDLNDKSDAWKGMQNYLFKTSKIHYREQFFFAEWFLGQYSGKIAFCIAKDFENIHYLSYSCMRMKDKHYVIFANCSHQWNEWKHQDELIWNPDEIRALDRIQANGLLKDLLLEEGWCQGQSMLELHHLIKDRAKLT